MQFQKYLKAVATGPKGNHDLTLEEAEDALEQILSQQVAPERIAAFLIGWRLKPESIEEFQATLNVCDKYTQHTFIKESIELGYAFDGKAKYPYLLPSIASYLKNYLQIVTSTDNLQPSKDGVTLEALFAQNPLAQNLHLFHRENYLPELHNLTNLRNLLGLRTAFNTTEKLSQVAQSDFAITGVHHQPYVAKYMQMI